MNRFSRPDVYRTFILVALLVTTSTYNGCAPDGVGTTATQAASTLNVPTGGGALTVSPTSQSVAINSQIPIFVSGGTPPYTYSLSGGGSMNGSVYIAPSSTQTASITIWDSLGAVVVETLNVVNTTNNGLPFSSVQSNDILSGWSADGLIVPNPPTAYSSNPFATALNDRGTEVSAWFASAQSISTVTLTARMSGGTPIGFPSQYQIFLTAPDNSAWNFVGTFFIQPDVMGAAVISLGNTYQTYGVQIQPIVLGADDYGNHYFQLIGIAAQ